MVYRLVIEATQIQQGWVKLTQQQQHYLKRVLRLKDGAHFIAMDGKGQVWQAILQGESAQLRESLTESRELSIKLSLMVALPKGNGFEDILRSCTELGVTTFIPVISERTLLNPSAQKVERWRKIVLEAAEQSERQIVPQIVEPLDFATALIKVTEIAQDRYICVTRKKTKHLLTYLEKTLVKSATCRGPHPLIIATGPEGGWTTKEIESAQNADFQAVSLGSRIIRAITAPIYVASVVSAIVENQTLS